MENIYHFEGEENIDSPALIYYENIIEDNINKALGKSGNAERLWPHVKTFKSSPLVKILISHGISRFKCATIAEAEMCAQCTASNILLSYPLVGPMIGRFIKLNKAYPSSVFWAIGDNLEQLSLLGEAALKEALNISFLIDVNSGMDRTGVSLNKLKDFCIEAAKIQGLTLKGLHCYDGHLRMQDIDERGKAVLSESDKIFALREELDALGIKLPFLVMGGSPTFPLHALNDKVFLSPGTLFLQDYAYKSNFSDLDFTPAAAILCRVISRPREDLFTIDLGHKAISSDQEVPGIIVGLREAKAIRHSEEHWVFQLDKERCPTIGSILYVLPSHICPTNALYPGVHVVKNGSLAGYWEITARDRKISI